MKVDVWIYIKNLGDGSCHAKFYRTEQEAEAAASKCHERYCDDVYKQTLEFDKKGILVKMDKD